MLTKVLITALGTFVLAGSVFAQADADAIRGAFQTYRAALEARNGEAARALVTRATLDSYEALRDEAIYSVKVDLAKRPIFERLIILNLRLRFTLTELQMTPGRDLFRRGIEEGWTAGASGLSNLERLVLIDNHAQAFIVPRSGGGEGTPIHFLLEDGAWKIDLISISNAVEESLRDLAVKNGISEEQLIEETLGSSYGQALPTDIWEPLLR